MRRGRSFGRDDRRARSPNSPRARRTASRPRTSACRRASPATTRYSRCSTRSRRASGNRTCCSASCGSSAARSRTRPRSTTTRWRTGRRSRRNCAPGPPQTNEAGRCAVLLPVLAALPQPLALLEVGASAGLCLYPDRYAYRYGDHGDRLRRTGPRLRGDRMSHRRPAYPRWCGGPAWT